MMTSTTRGYTLVELIVSVAIFAIVMLSATSAYLAFLNYNRRAVSHATLMNSLSFAIDSMARDIRTGTEYCRVGSCTSGGESSINFLDANLCEVTYAFASGEQKLTKSTEATLPGCVARDTTLISPSVTPGITLTSVKFYIRGEGSDDHMQSIATVVLRGTTLVVDTGEEIPFAIQTSATSRVPDAGD